MPPRIVDKFVDEQCLKLSALHSGSSLNFARSSVNVNSTFPVSQSNCHVIGNHNLATSVSLHLKDSGATFINTHIFFLIFLSLKDGAYVYAKASGKGKRIQCNINSKNHAVVMSDASMDATLNALVAAGFGGVGQKCIALNIVVFVGSLTPWEDKLVEYAKALKVTAGTKPDANLGPVISKQRLGGHFSP
ncbi:hypothetical protein Pint_03584 [Pistacia integerrima]|uniref:Uncharacterized protein n=1 Tax=Pistacia integerrima TaxID=434235 RepID=A0ACC0ZKU2_9ROSI|nr:hypothetical protein Pint_03584 [Pistacia integerrima]